MNSQDFLNELNGAFDELLPQFTTRNAIESFDDDSDNGMASLYDWSSVIKEHNTMNQPRIPQPAFRIASTTGSYQQSVSSSNQRKKPKIRKCDSNNSSSKNIHNAEIKNSLRIIGSDSKAFSMDARLTGWNLSKGWKLRPPAIQVNMDKVEENIKRFALKKTFMKINANHGILGRHSSDSATNSNTSHNSIDDLTSDIDSRPDFGYYHYYSTAEGKEVKRQQLKQALREIRIAASTTPGPRYNTRLSLDRDSTANNAFSQRNDSTSKSITFHKGTNRFLPINSCVLSTPAPSKYKPLNKTIAGTTDLPCIDLGMSFRTDHGSIYKGAGNEGVGPAYALDEPSKHLSSNFPCNGMNMGIKK